MRLCKHGRITYCTREVWRGRKKRVRVARSDSRSNSNLLSAREISQIHDNSMQCNSAQLKALTNCFITLPVEMCIQTDPKTRTKEILATRFANVISARHWILCNVSPEISFDNDLHYVFWRECRSGTEFDCAALLAML